MIAGLKLGHYNVDMLMLMPTYCIPSRTEATHTHIPTCCLHIDEIQRPYMSKFWMMRWLVLVQCGEWFLGGNDFQHIQIYLEHANRVLHSSWETSMSYDRCSKAISNVDAMVAKQYQTLMWTLNLIVSGLVKRILCNTLPLPSRLSLCHSMSPSRRCKYNLAQDAAPNTSCCSQPKWRQYQAMDS